jgi:hypothetical protein
MIGSFNFDIGCLEQFLFGWDELLIISKMITMAFFRIEVVIFLILLLQMHGFQLDDPRWFRLGGDLIWMCSGISRIREGLLFLDGVWVFVPLHPY